MTASYSALQKPLLINVSSGLSVCHYYINHPTSLFLNILSSVAFADADHSSFKHCALCERKIINFAYLQTLVDDSKTGKSFADYHEYVAEKVLCVEASGANVRYKRVVVHRSCVAGLNRVYSADRADIAVSYDDFSGHEIHAAVRDLTSCIPIP